MLDYTGLRNGLVVTAFWKAKPDETEAVAAILQRFMPQAQQEPGVRAFMIHRSKSEPSKSGAGRHRHPTPAGSLGGKIESSRRSRSR